MFQKGEFDKYCITFNPKRYEKRILHQDNYRELREKVLCGKYSLRKATEELYKAGWLNYIDEEKARIILNLNYNDNIF